MVDVSAKSASARIAVAKARVTMSKAALAALVKANAKKGDVLGTARLAGIMAAKRTAELIPLCHALPLSEVAVDFETDASGVAITARAKTVAQTGVEMEALTAVSVAALTLYDMLKAVDRAMTIADVRLVEKNGGHSGRYQAP
jgi:cyclic pyranopterin phosphate synthase